MTLTERYGLDSRALRDACRVELRFWSNSSSPPSHSYSSTSMARWRSHWGCSQKAKVGCSFGEWRRTEESKKVSLWTIKSKYFYVQIKISLQIMKECNDWIIYWVANESFWVRRSQIQWLTFQGSISRKVVSSQGLSSIFLFLFMNSRTSTNWTSHFRQH